MAEYFVYILASRSRTLYVGVTRDIRRRMGEHRDGSAQGFTHRYKVSRLVYVETTSDVRAAIAREKQIKGWTRDRKLALVALANPNWQDLAEGWFQNADPSLRSG
jgi:putative endonuclease